MVGIIFCFTDDVKGQSIPCGVFCYNVRHFDSAIGKVAVRSEGVA